MRVLIIWLVVGMLLESVFSAVQSVSFNFEHSLLDKYFSSFNNNVFFSFSFLFFFFFSFRPFSEPSRRPLHPTFFSANACGILSHHLSVMTWKNVKLHPNGENSTAIHTTLQFCRASSRLSKPTTLIDQKTSVYAGNSFYDEIFSVSPDHERIL